MYGKGLFFILLLGGVAVVPYLLSDEKWLSRIEDLVGQTSASDASPDPAEAQAPVKTTTAGKVVAGAPSQPLLSPSPTNRYTSRYVSDSTAVGMSRNIGVDMPLPHLLSFEATPEWISQNWDRVTNRIGELDLHGWRVPYFRSSQHDDFAGSVTYYFDRARLVQRIVLHGYTSDAAEFVQLGTSHYRMKRVHSPEGDLYIANVEDQPIGALQLRYAPLLHAKNKERQCEVLMELNRRGTEYGMSYEFDRLIRDTRKANALLTPIQPLP